MVTHGIDELKSKRTPPRPRHTPTSQKPEVFATGNSEEGASKYKISYIPPTPGNPPPSLVPQKIHVAFPRERTKTVKKK